MQDVAYQIGDVRCQNALTAWGHAMKTGTTPKLALPDAFSTYDWTSEPQASIQELEQEYALALHVKNPNLRLMYSGGTDSHSIAVAFAKLGIPLKYTLIDFDTMHRDYLDAPIWQAVKLDLLRDMLAEHGMPEPEFEVITIDKKMIEAHFVDKFFEKNVFYGCNQSFNLNHMSEALRYSKWDPTKTTNIYGVEKPRLYQDNTGIFWQITDTMSMYAANKDYNSVWFYTSADALDLVAKQCWNIIRHCLSKWPRLPFSHSSSLLQTTDAGYFEWNTVLGRQTNLWWALKSRATKTFKPTTENKHDPRYTHLSYYRDDGSKAWNNYMSLFDALEDLTGERSIIPITTDRFYLTKD